jgi:hypothetical protein
MNASIVGFARRLAPSILVAVAACSSPPSTDAPRTEAPAATADRGGDGRRYDILGLRRVTRAAPAASFRGAVEPQYRGVFIGLKNAAPAETLRGVRITLDETLTTIFTGGGARDADDVPLLGGTMQIGDGGRELTLSGLSIAPGEWAHLWIDLSAPPPTGALFEATALYR